MTYKHGQWFTAVISDVECTGRISIGEAGGVYLCQDYRNGKYVHDKHGFRYSWCIINGTEEDLQRHSVKNLILHKSKPRDFKNIRPISIGRHPVTKKNDEIVKVGCIPVTREQYLAVGKLMDWIE